MKPKKDGKGEKEFFSVLEIPMDEEDIRHLSEKPRRATAWMSKKLESRGKELRWSQMPLEQKYQFDEAQCRELSQVLTAKAVRSLSQQEELKVDPAKLMAMRWVMTVKAGGEAKARLVDLYVRAPAELAVLFGAPPDQPFKILKICRAFYGLVHAPRKWFDHVVGTLKSHTWQQLLSDQCTFILIDDGRTIGAAGIHVDDFLIGGDRTNKKFQEAEHALQNAYRRGKWQHKSFTFAGCDLRQDDDFSICMAQESYVGKWLDECSIEKEGAQNA
eukprot:s2397_g3.t1